MSDDVEDDGDEEDSVNGTFGSSESVCHVEAFSFLSSSWFRSKSTEKNKIQVN